MHRRPASFAASSLPAVAHALGFRSVEQVRVTSCEGRTTAEVTGVLHRYPQRVPVSLAAAVRLARAGAPLHIDTCGRVVTS
jgi:hypothetical protein